MTHHITLRSPLRFLAWLVMFFRQAKCAHEFYIEDIEFTGIPENPKPQGRGYDEWAAYFEDYYEQPAVTQRIVCNCFKCRKEFFAHCGLNLPGKLKQRRHNDQV